jgi:hypothetical protein
LSKYEHDEITVVFSNEGTRNDIRKRVVDKLFGEVPGKGAARDASRYKYFVETLSNGDRIYLQRPARLHNGFDFLICVENHNYSKPDERKRNYPKHDDLIEDLKQKKRKEPDMYAKLYYLIKKVYECHDVSDDELAEVTFSTGLPADHVVKVFKWFFIEQDIRYWNYSGRTKTWNEAVPKP